RGGLLKIVAMGEPLDRIERRSRGGAPSLEPARRHRLARFEYPGLSAQPRLNRPAQHACDRAVKERKLRRRFHRTSHPFVDADFLSSRHDAYASSFSYRGNQ